MNLDDLEQKAKAATQKWTSRTRDLGRCEYEIVQAGGGVLFRSTSYGNASFDAAYIAAASPDVVLRLLDALHEAKIGLCLLAKRWAENPNHDLDIRGNLVTDCFARIDAILEVTNDK